MCIRDSIDIDEDGFHAEMQKQKERARAERLKKNISGWSEDLFGGLTAEPTVFTGYDTLRSDAVVVALSDEETLTDAIATDEQAKEDVLVVLDKTPFYAEMGGQAADHGVITGAECSLRVLDVKKTPKGYYVHTCVLESGIVKVCLLYTSDAADEEDSVDLGGSRIIKKKKNNRQDNQPNSTDNVSRD